MKQYPSIPRLAEFNPGPSCEDTYYIYDKIDGSNIRIEWSHKKGFHKFGSRKQLFDETHPMFGKVIALAKNMEPQFSKMFNSREIRKAICFFEFYGPNSFAGSHVETDEHKLCILDIFVERHGLLSQEDFINFIKDLGGCCQIPLVIAVYKGDVGPNTFFQRYVEAVENGTMPYMTFEGVVVKSKTIKKWGQPKMFKIKNKKWIEKVKELHKGSSNLDDLL